jgi:hypothetical protein
MTLTRAKTTTMIRENLAPVPLPNLVLIHSAPVITFDRLSHGEIYTINVPDALDIPNKYQGRLFPPGKQDLIFWEALFDTQLPMKMVAVR